MASGRCGCALISRAHARGGFGCALADCVVLAIRATRQAPDSHGAIEESTRLNMILQQAWIRAASSRCKWHTSHIKTCPSMSSAVPLTFSNPMI
jgi:hypothetical protein